MALGRRFQQPNRDTGKRLRINDFIRISPVRLIDDNNEQIGVVDLDEAKRRAREAGLDLVEVSPLTRPPVCRIMDYGKWKYQQKKKEQKAQSHSKASELKELRVRPKIDDHDLKIKTEKAREFLNEGDKVQFTLMFKGREMAHQDIGMKTLAQIREILADVSKVEAMPRLMGKRMTMLLAPDKKPKAPKSAPGSAAPGSPAPAPAPAPGSAAPAAGSAATGSAAASPAPAAPRPAPVAAPQPAAVAAPKP